MTAMIGRMEIDVGGATADAIASRRKRIRNSWY